MTSPHITGYVQRVPHARITAWCVAFRPALRAATGARVHGGIRWRARAGQGPRRAFALCNTDMRLGAYVGRTGCAMFRAVLNEYVKCV